MANEFSRHPIFRLGWSAARAHAIFHGHAALFVFAQRGVNKTVLVAHMAVDNGEVFFLHGAAFDDFSKFASDGGIFCDHDHSAGFPVKPVHEMRIFADGHLSEGR